MNRFDHVTVMVCNPRSRSQWMAYFMGFGCVAWHDPLKHCAHPIDLVAMIEEWTAKNPGRRLFIADTLAASFAVQLQRAMPGAYFFKVVRPLPDVRHSIAKQLGSCEVASALQAHNRRLLDLRMDCIHFSRINENLDHLWPLIANPGAVRPDTSRFSEAVQTVIDYPIASQGANAHLLTQLMRHLDP